MRLFIVALLLVVMTSAADARSRVRITAPTDPWVPGTALYWFSQNVCTFVAWSVAPDWPAAQQQLMLGKCPPRPAPRFT